MEPQAAATAGAPKKHHRRPLKKSVRRAKGKQPHLGGARKREETIKKLQCVVAKTNVKRCRKSPRLYMKAVLAGFRRGLSHQRKHIALLRIDDVNTTKDAAFYVGKRTCYVYHGYKIKRCVRWRRAPVRRSNTRAMWGRVTRVHGGSGMVRAKFHPTLPGQAIGRRVRVYLYPSRI